MHDGKTRTTLMAHTEARWPLLRDPVHVPEVLPLGGRQDLLPGCAAISPPTS